MPSLQDRIAQYVSENGPCSVRQIKDALGLPTVQVANATCNRLSNAGLFLKDDSHRPHLFSFCAQQPLGERPIFRLPNIKRRRISEEVGQMTIEQLKEHIQNKIVLYVIPCCGTKSQNNFAALHGQQLVHLLPQELQAQLYSGRNESLELIDRPPAVNPNGAEFAVMNHGGNIYLPAFDRYKGYLYKVNGIHNILQQHPRTVTIMSALYGLIMASDNIQKYNLSMERTEKIWANRNRLPIIIDHYANIMEATIIIGLFGASTAYNRLFSKLRLIPNPHCNVIRVHTVNNGPNRNWISTGLGHALRYFIGGVPPPNGFEYTVSNVR